MWRLTPILALAGCLWLAPVSRAAEPATGNWKLSYNATPTIEMIDSIFKLEKTDGKWTVTMVASNPRLGNTDAGEVTLKDNILRIVIKRPTGESVFEGVVANDAKTILGSFGDDRRLNAGGIVWTEDETIEANVATKPRTVAPPIQKISQLETAHNRLRVNLQRATEDDEKTKIRDEMAEKQKELDAEVPKLLKEVIANHKDHPSALDAIMRLMRDAKKYKATPDDITEWSQIAIKLAGRHGPRFRAETSVGLIELVANNPDYRSVVANLAKQAEKELGPDASPLKLERVLTVLVMALGTGPDAKLAADRLESVASKADAEYVSNQPKIQAKPYAGRKDASSQVVFMELFTGAQCPPCVAADIAFDKLTGAYNPTELVLLQYHLHVPGPDPMTNSDTEARWKYYKDAFPEQVRGVPSSMFNGKVEGGGGGGTAQAAGKLAQFRKIIDPLLDETQKAKITVKAARTGDSVTIAASVSDIEEPSETLKLRFALVEDTVRYPGGNGIRLHHHVVRAMPGGADGMALAGKNESKQVTVNVPEVRGQLTKYLDDFVAKGRPFAKPNRPLDLKHLKVIAWVQDDKDKVVIQAAQADVGEAASGE